MQLEWGNGCCVTAAGWPCPPQNRIPVLSPALTDGSLGDMMFFHSFKNPGLVLDIVEGEVWEPRRRGKEAPEAWH